MPCSTWNLSRMPLMVASVLRAKIARLARNLPSSKPGWRVRLPDVRALLRRDVHRVARLDAERVVPGLDVRQRAQHAEAARAMRIGGDLAAKRIGTLLL